MTLQDVILYYPSAAAPTTTVRIRAPDFGDGETVDRRQVIDETAAGNLIVFDRGPLTYHLDHSFELMPRSERDALESFFVSTVLGARNQFEYRVPRYENLMRGNPLGAFLYTGATFESGTLEFRQTMDGWFEVAFSIRATGRSNV